MPVPKRSIIKGAMDFSANFHHQLQLENQLLLGSGNGHAWNPDVTFSPSCDFEPSFHVQDMNSATIIDGESCYTYTSLQHYFHGSKDKKFIEKGEEEEASASSPKTNGTLNSHCCSFEDLNKIAQSCCCCCSTKIHPTLNVSSRQPLMAELSSFFGFDHTVPFQQSTKMPNHEITQAKRPCSLKQQKPTQAPPKKPRVEPRATCPPLKIRKEKLGDRIAALQQLVAPFGKTDTASVLMEAISYINFLQNQVEMLSHSYMKSCRSKNYKTTCRDESNEKDKKPESDLKAKGLCLVPTSCISYLPEDTSTGGRIGNIWPPLTAASFNRRTF
ncbi:Transcription factor basic helix-loop-helix 110, partial [Cucurbita argyrosperma subsp. sororia]